MSAQAGIQRGDRGATGRTRSRTRSSHPRCDQLRGRSTVTIHGDGTVRARSSPCRLATRRDCRRAILARAINTKRLEAASTINSLKGQSKRELAHHGPMGQDNLQGGTEVKVFRTRGVTLLGSFRQAVPLPQCVQQGGTPQGQCFGDHL